jgi:hypothetical protein
VAVDTIEAAKAGGGLVFDFLRFAFSGAVFARIAFPKMAGQAALRPDPDAFPVEVCPRSAATIARHRTRKLKGSGKPKLTRADGL